MDDGGWPVKASQLPNQVEEVVGALHVELSAKVNMQGQTDQDTWLMLTAKSS